MNELIKNEIKDANIFIRKTARTIEIDTNWLQHTDFNNWKCENENNFDDYWNTLIELCWEQFPSTTKSITMKFMFYDGNKMYQDTLPSKQTRN